MLRMWSFCISGPVCVRGGRFMMILMSFWCVLISGCRYVFAMRNPHRPRQHDASTFCRDTIPQLLGADS